jgi:arylsulfatase A-like enzyme
VTTTQPNIVIVLADDLGYSDLGCYGGEIRTPNLDRLAAEGVRLTNFHNSPRCSPSRASLLTGLHPHQTGIGILTNDDRPAGYAGSLNDRCVVVAETLRDAGYDTAVRGKWHLASDMKHANPAWPTERGFDSFWGTLTGCGSFYQPGTLTRDTESAEHEALDPDFFYTDRIGQEAVEFLERQQSTGPERPFFLYVPFTAPHWPLHARPETIAGYRDVYEAGWDAIRQRRWERQRELGIVPGHEQLSPRDPGVAEWDAEPEKSWQAARMSAYAAQVEEMDTAIGRIVSTLEEQGRFDDTIFIFLSDNGASDESLPQIELERFRQRRDILRTTTKDGRPVQIGNDPAVAPGGEDTYQSYGRSWANVSNTPFRLYKLWAHEGGISTPFIVRWPGGQLPAGNITRTPHQLTDVVPTLLEATGANYPETRDGVEVHPLPGASMLDALRGLDADRETSQWWEHTGNGALRRGKWKLVRQWGWPWELYDLELDRSETLNLADEHPELVAELSAEWQDRCDRYGVIPFERTMELYHARGREWKDAIG